MSQYCSGTVLTRFNPLKKGERIPSDLAVKCNSIEIHNDVGDGNPLEIEELKESFKSYWAFYENNPIKGRNAIINALCPEVSMCISMRMFIFLILT